VEQLCLGNRKCEIRGRIQADVDHRYRKIILI
jgi:hypothetical protein